MKTTKAIRDLLMFMAMVVCLFIIASVGQAETAHWDYPYPENTLDSFTFTAVELSDDPGAPILEEGILKSLRSIPITGFIVGKSYLCTVSAVLGEAKGVSFPPFLYSKKPATPDNPEYVEGLVSWEAVEGLSDGYRVYYEIVDSGNPQTQDVGEGVTEVILTDLVCGGLYEISVVSLMNEIESIPSVVLVEQVPPCSPTNVRVLY